MKDLKCEGCGDTFTIGFLNKFDEKFCEQCKKDLDY